MRANRVDKVEAVRFRNRVATKVPGCRDNGFTFLRRNQPKSHVFDHNLGDQGNGQAKGKMTGVWNELQARHSPRLIFRS